MFCANCGKKLEDGAAFCDQCGSAIGQPESVSSQPNIGMKKSLGRLPVIIGICAAAVIVTISSVALAAKMVFDGKDADAISDDVEKDAVEAKAAKKTEKQHLENADEAKVTKKTEKQYLESIGAYQDYYEQVCQNDEFYVYARVTIDKDGLPLLWLAYAKDESAADAASTRLLKFEKGEVKVLAEANDVTLCPIISSETISAMKWNQDAVYVYDEQKQAFNVVDLPGDAAYSDWMEHRAAQQDVLAANNVAVYHYYYAENDSEQTIAYIGKGKGLRTDWDSSSVNADDKFYYADGTETSWEEARRKMLLWDSLEDGSIDGGLGGVEWLEGLDVDKMFKVLQDNPVYSSEDLFMLLVANGLFFEMSDSTIYSIAEDINLNAYVIPELTDEKIAEMVYAYFFKGKFNEAYMAEDPVSAEIESGFREIRELVEENEIDAESEYKDGICTITLKKESIGSETFDMKFQIELNESGDKIKSIIPLDFTETDLEDPAASVPDWKEAYLSALSDGTIYSNEFASFGLLDILGDGVPELILCDDRNTLIYTVSGGKLILLLENPDYPYIKGDLMLFDSRYSISVYKMKADSVDSIFYAERDLETDMYYLNGNTLDYSVCMDEAAKLGIAADNSLAFKAENDLSGIMNAITSY